MYNVHVVGAGPAGSVAAMAAVRKGHNVLVSEEHVRAGFPMHCSGLFSKTGLESLRDFLDYHKTIKNGIYGAIIDFAGEKVEIRTKTPVAYVCDRAAFDALLAKGAEREGARMEYGRRITGRYEAGSVIGADGPFSHVAQQFGFPKISRYVSTVQSYIKYKSEHPGQVEVFLSNEKFPGFFAWVIPHNEEIAEFGAGVSLPHNVGRAWHALLKMKGMRRAGKIRGAVIPAAVRRKTTMRIGRKNVLLVGDAAGQVKSTTGGGVIIGSNCAKYAGEHCDSPFGYELAWRSRYGMDLFFHKLINAYFSGRSDAQLLALGKKIKKMNLDRYLSLHGHMDMPTRMIKPQIIPHLLRYFL